MSLISQRPSLRNAAPETSTPTRSLPGTLTARLRGWFTRLSAPAEAKDMLPAPHRRAPARRPIPEGEVNSLLL
ncbi:hypothetical protein [Aureimonas sp. AU20]|uniref:hypothetical protein n=1 Tax=Aureimonas sp. AU20 TaxID=1349819 RepID=UPI0007225E6D|nr:hypothetical protein [Aureimonas sp. AU20]ALN75612.1 hypothetical protein M673_22980 [Aureimonas sp. AU20]